MSSMAYTLAEANTSDPNFDEGREYAPWVAYGRSKTANILGTVGLKEKYGDVIVPITIDPGCEFDKFWVFLRLC